MNLIEWRTEKGLKQFQAAVELGLSQAQLSRIEGGKQWPEPATIAQIEERTEGAVTANDILATYRAAQPQAAA